MSASWRGYLGLILPTYRGKAFAFWYKNLPSGIECAPAVLGFGSGDKATFDEDRSFRRAEELSRDLFEVGCGIITVSGSPPFILRGPDYELEWRQNLETRLGVSVVSGMAPHVVAAKALGIKRIALATYYNDELNDGISQYFVAQGIDTEIIPGFQQNDGSEGLYSTSMRGLDGVSYEDVYRHCKKGVVKLGKKVDGLYINGGGWDAAPVVAHLEEDLGIPVIWAMAAEMWLTLGLLDVGEPVNGFGRLLADRDLRRHREVAFWKGE